MDVGQGNNSTYNSKSVVQWYSYLTELAEVENVIFHKYSNVMAEGSVLDIGIGGGRTTKYLIDKCKKYTGVDYGSDFVANVKQKFPLADIQLMDARDLSAFGANSFDFVNFSFNGIDYVNIEGRIKILNEVNRVLKPNGVFFFSTHNKSHTSFNKWPWRDETCSFISNIKTFIKLVPYMIKHYWKKREEIYKETYAIVNDCAHNYSLMTFYTTPEFLIEQLVTNKFTKPELYLRNGNVVAKKDLGPWIFAVCKKSMA